MKTGQSRVETDLLPKPNTDVHLESEDVETGGTTPQKDCRLGERNHMSVLDGGGSGAPRVKEASQESAPTTKTGEGKRMDTGVGKCAEDDNEDPTDPLSSSDRPCLKSEDCLESGETHKGVVTQPAVPKEDRDRDTPGDEGLHCSDNYLSGRSESDEDEEDEEDVVLLLSDECIPCVTDDESHYITTHEIQLSELSDHESDLGVGSSTSWDLEEDNQLYSFVDYATFDSGGAAAAGERGRGSAPRDAAKVSSSDESGSKPQQGNSAGGQIRLSIRTTSRAINDPGNVHEEGNVLYRATRSGDVRQCVFRGVDGRTETLCDRAKCLIAAPGRLHFGIGGCSSGESSAVSELDEADKEVRGLTSRAFRSLAYPYLDAFNFSTSSESSASERGPGRSRLSTFIDLKCGNVNLSRGLGRGLVTQPKSTATFPNGDSRGYKGVGPASINPPTREIFTLNADPRSATSSTKKIELMGKFGQGHGGVITLTETLNFRCNVNSGMSGGERRANFTQSASGSCSRDGVTGAPQGGQRRGARHPPPGAMEDTHKKAIFASSLIKNVISKKMQFEQERKMERGEISEPHQTPSPSLVSQEGKGSSELHRQSSKLSESSSDYATMSAEDSGAIVDGGASRRQDAAAAPEPADEAGVESKRGAKSTLHRSHNSAFRCWKDEELELQKDPKNQPGPEDETPANDGRGEEAGSSPRCGKPTQMSRLFVPSIQVLSTDGDVGQQPQRGERPARKDAARGEPPRADNTLRVAESGSGATSKSKSPEIKIHLKSVRSDRAEGLGVSKLRTPNIGRNAAGSLIGTEDFRSQALAAALRGESSDKVPQFNVRDVRDGKGKLQTPIHHVRDVRKLVKSSYHFVSVDSNDNKTNADSQPDQAKQTPRGNPNSVSPIVIKCQSVNTNTNGKQSGSHADLPRAEPVDVDRASPERTAGRAPAGKSSEGDPSPRTQSLGAPKKQDKTSDTSDKRTDSKVTNQVALEKLQAAVKTMEQLYVFDRNEWKRKSEPRPLTDSHVLSLIASKEHGGPEEDGTRGPNVDKATPAVVASPGADTLLRREDKPSRAAGGRDAVSTQATGATLHKNMVSLSSAAPKTAQQHAVSEAPLSSKSLVPKSPKLPRPSKNRQVKPSGLEGSGAESKDSERSTQELSGPAADNENYLTIPVKSHASGSKQASFYTVTTQTRPTSPSRHATSGPKEREDAAMSPKRPGAETETRSPEIPSATIYHSMPLGMTTGQPQLFCFSPAITPTPTLDPFQATQRKMLLDPATGNYYLVDTPVQPATKRLFDPETGQYVDVSMPQPATTPVPMQISPLALCPGAYGHTYMFYPGFMPAPSVMPARTLVQSQMSAQSEEKASSQPTEGLYMESPFYMATGTGGSPQAASGAQQPQAAVNKPLQGFPSVKQPVISITSQQGPRIVAPPSFDGTTMSFVVEHR